MNTSRPLPSFARKAAALGVLFACIVPVQAQTSPDTPGAARPPGTSADRPGDTSMPGTRSSGTLSGEGREFIEKSAKSGLKEVHLSRLASERSTNAEVRQLAQMLVTEHQQANAQLAAIANEKGVHIPLETAAASMRMQGDSSDGASSGGAGAGERATTPGTGSSGRASGGDAAADRRTGGSAGATAPAPTGEAARAGAGMQTELEAEIREATAKLSGKSGAEFDRAYVELMIESHRDSIERFQAQANRTGDAELAEFARQTLPKLRNHLTRAQSVQRQLEG